VALIDSDCAPYADKTGRIAPAGPVTDHHTSITRRQCAWAGRFNVGRNDVRRMWHSSGCSLRTENAEIIERPPTDCGPGSLLFVDRLRIGRVIDELVVRDFGLRLRLRAATACSQNVSMALIRGVQAQLA
jgi:hypothetical protein